MDVDRGIPDGERRDAHGPKQRARRLGQILLRLVCGAGDDPAAVVRELPRRPVLVVVAASDVHETGPGLSLDGSK